MKANPSGWEVGIASDKGPVKMANEDHATFLHTKNESGKEATIALIADGMGGYQAGTLASKTAVRIIKEWWEQRINSILMHSFPIVAMAQELNERLHNINEHLLSIGEREGIQLGTTLSVLVLFQNQYLIYHVGDSRIYKNGRKSFAFETAELGKGSSALSPKVPRRLMQLTQDHSWVASQVKLGYLTKEEARKHYKRNVLLQCLGVNSGLCVFQSQGRFVPGDLFLLCSDGFHSMFSDSEIRRLLCSHQSKNLQRVSQSLVYSANEAGTIDNITVVLIKFHEHLSSQGTSWKNLLKNRKKPFKAGG